MLVQTSGSKVNMLAEDDFGIVYLIENAQQFWSGALYHMFRVSFGHGKRLELTIEGCQSVFSRT